MRLNDEYGIFIKNETVVNLIDTIEALQAENEQYNQDRINAQGLWAEACEDVIKLQQENEQLQAQVTKMRHQLERILPCLKAMESTEHLFRHVIADTEELLSINTVHYHNPADMKALRKAREALEYCIDTLAPMAAVSHLGGQKGKMQEVCEEALAEIDKAIGEKEDV